MPNKYKFHLQCECSSQTLKCSVLGYIGSSINSNVPTSKKIMTIYKDTAKITEQVVLQIVQTDILTGSTFCAKASFLAGKFNSK